jgi:hypothetical protein
MTPTKTTPNTLGIRTAAGAALAVAGAVLLLAYAGRALLSPTYMVPSVLGLLLLALGVAAAVFRPASRSA